MAHPTPTVRLATQQDKKTWDERVSHPLQTWAWGAFRAQTGVETVRLIAQSRGKTTDAWQLTFHHIPRTSYTIGYFPKGPTPTAHMLKALKDIGKEKNALFIQLEPNILEESGFAIQDLSAQAGSRFYPSHRPLFTKHTFVLDLTQSETALLANADRKTRYNTRLAKRKGVVIEKDNSDSAFQTYLTLADETTKRQAYYAHSRSYQASMWHAMSKAGIAHLFLAKKDKTPLAAWIIFALHDTMYYPYGASSSKHRNLMASNLMLYETARWGKRKGYKRYDLWGCLGPTPDTRDPFYGFHKFKAGYNPTLVTFAGSYDLVLRPSLYRLYTYADTIRWTMLEVRARMR